jgi:hypothetical protein
MLTEIDVQNELAPACAGYGRLHWQQGNVAQARNYVNRARDIFERLGTLIEPERVRRALAELPSVDLGSGVLSNPVKLQCSGCLVTIPRAANESGRLLRA